MEQVAMELISKSGEARSLAFQALQEAKAGRTDEAALLMKESLICSKQAHKAQSKLLFSESEGNKTEITVLLIHAQDHLMNSLLAQELIKEIIELHESKADKSN
ncbi:PTS lactose/cellobiose transporter subunit IIA [Paenibacillus donghaensis]|uniref:PTS lactose/cellobiose transporter subunit IIA n=2 Tax=Paenibacillus donghaensis TaxID=414771 RepID=A0A2Z2KK76_9BACL|nr:PTS lactose/cellobiose transporter subunit IIA [Paenibacillus donghaensis]